MDPLPTTAVSDLTWSHVGIVLVFVAFNIAISQTLHLHVGTPFLIATIRCTVQLAVAASVLQYLFTTKNTLAVAGITGTSFLA
jgi:ABC-type iron transport system FetAB permease component